MSAAVRAVGNLWAQPAGVRWNRHAAWWAACGLSWLVCYPFFGPVLSLAALVVPSLAFSPLLVSLGFVLRHRASKDLRFSWSPKQLRVPASCFLAVQTVSATALAIHLAQPLSPHYRLAYLVAVVLSCLGGLAAHALRADLGGGAQEAPRSSTPERLIVLSALASAAGFGLFAWAVRRGTLPIAYGEQRFSPRWRSVAGVYGWLDGQLHTSLFGPSVEQPYWPLLPAGAGLVVALVAVGAKQAAGRATREPFTAEEESNGGKVFLSYSRNDADFARALTSAIQGQVREVWVDWQAIKPSEKWRQSIADGIRESDALIVLVSRSSLASPYCWDECRQAIELRKRILPVVIEADLASGTTAVLRDAGWDELTEFQRLDMSEPDRFEDDVRRVVSFVAQEHRWVAGHTRLGLQAHDWQQSGRSEGFLLRADELRSAQWLRDYVPSDSSFRAALTDAQHAFIDASRAALRRRGIRFRTGAAAVLLALAGLASLVVAVQAGAQTAQRQTLSRTLAAAAQNEAAGHLDTSSLLAAAAYTESDTAEARSAMADRLMHFNHAVEVLPGTGTPGAGAARLVFSVNGSVLAVESSDGTTQLWDTRGWRLRATLRGVLPVQGEHGLSTDGRWVALLDGARITVTDTTTMRVAGSFDLLGAGLVGSWFGGLSPDGRTLVGSFGTVAQIWNVLNRRELSQSSCATLSLSPSGKEMWCQQDGGTWLRDAQSGLASLDVRITGNPTLMGWEADDEPLIALADSTAAALPADGRGEPWIPEQGMSLQAVSDDGTRALLTGGTRLTYEVWDLPGRRKLGDVTAAQLTQQGLSVTGSSSDEQLATLADLTPTYGMLLSTGGERGSGVWSASRGRLEADDNQIAYTRDGRTAATVTATAAVAVWDRGPDGRLVSQIPDGDLSAVRYSAVSPDGKTVAAVDSGTVRLFSTRTGAAGTTIGLTGTGNGVVYSPDGSRLAVSETLGTGVSTGQGEAVRTVVELFSVADGKRTVLLNSPSPPDAKEWTSGLAFAPDGRRLYLGLSQAMTVYAWDLSTGRVVQEFGPEGSGHIEAVALSPDGRSLVTVDVEHTLRQWDTTTGRVLWSFQGASQTVAFSPDGRTLAAASDSGQSLLIWNAATHQSTGTPFDVGSPIGAVQLSGVDGVAVVTLAATADGGGVLVLDLLHRAVVGPVIARVGAGSTARLTSDGRYAVAVGPGGILTAVVDPAAWKDSLCSLADQRFPRSDWLSYAPDQRYLAVC